MSKIILLLSILISLNLCLKGQVLTSKNYYDNIIWECIPVQAKEFDTFAINYNMCGISDVTASISASRYGGFKDLNIYEGTGKIKRIDIEYFVLIDKFGVQEKLLQEKYLLSYNTVSQLLTRNRQTFVYANNRLSSVSPNSNTFSIANNIEGVKYEYDTKGLLSKIHTLNDDKLLYKRDEKNRVNKVIFEESRRGIARYTFVYEYANGTDYIISVKAYNEEGKNIGLVTMSYDNHYNISNLRIVDASGEEITKRFEYDYSNHIVLRVCEKNGTVFIDRYKNEYKNDKLFKREWSFESSSRYGTNGPSQLASRIYKYDNNGNWVEMQEGSNLIKRKIEYY